MTQTRQDCAFTLVELLIYMGIFAIVATTITGILVTAVRVQNQEVASTEVTQQLNFVLNTVQRLVAQSSEVEKTYEGTNPSNPCTTFCTLKLRMVPSGTGGLDPTLISSTASGVYVQQGAGAQTALTNTQITVNNLKFTVYSTSGGHATVQVNASFSYNSSNPQLAITKTLQSAVGRVSAATFDSSLLPDTNSTRDVGQANPTLRWRDIYLAGLLGFGNIASDTPSALAPGSVYYDTLSTSNKLRFWNGTAWGDISPWSTGTGTVYYTGGSVGIGTTSPGALLDLGLAGTTAGVIRLAGPTSGNATIQTAAAAGTATALTLPATTGKLLGTSAATAGQYGSAKYTTTTTLDWANGNVQYIQLASAGQTFTFANPLDGGRYVLILKQPASGAAGTVTWPLTVSWSGGTAPTLTATNSKVDIITFVYDATNSKYYAGNTLNF